jgi:hypothetical protein
MNDSIVYYLKHPSTNIVYFEKRENLMQVIDSCLDLCLSVCSSTHAIDYPFSIEIGCINLTPTFPEQE